jgi:hypothetical protein
VIALLAALLFAPVVFPLSAWIVNKGFDAAEWFGRFRGRICL